MSLNLNGTKQSFEEFQNEMDAQIKTIDKNAFVDGVINIENYLNQSVKILWILKEPHHTDGEILNWRDEIRSISRGNLNGFRKTFENIVYITYGILHRKKINEINSIDNNSFLANVLNNIAFINVKKTPGESSISYKKLEQGYKLFKNILLNQINVLQPHVIINATGNNLPILREDIKNLLNSLTLNTYITTSELGIDYSEDKKIIVFNSFHPQANKPSREIYCADIINSYISLT